MDPKQMVLLGRKQVFLSNGRRLWLVIGPDGFPDFDSTRFLVSLYQEGSAPNTLKNVADGVRLVRWLETTIHTSINRRFQQGKILTRAEVVTLIAGCGRSLETEDRKQRPKKVLALLNGNASMHVKKRVRANTQRYRAFYAGNDKYDFRNNPELFDQVVAAAEFTGGWRPDSDMVRYYKQRFVYEQANEVTLATQARMTRDSKTK